MHILLCYSKTTALDLKMWIHMMAGEHQLEVKEVACESEEFEKVLSDEAADESLAAIVGMDNAGKAVLQVHDVPKLLINPVLSFCSEEEEKRVLGSATRFDRDNTWGIFNCEGDNEKYYEKMHSYSTNLTLQFGNHFNTANAELIAEGFFSDAVEYGTKR